jgi:hypothetical protein
MSKSKLISWVLGGLCLPMFFATAYAADPLTEMFTWWNQAFKTPGAFTPDAFRRFFTEDATIVLNGKQSSKGIAAMTAQFQKIQRETSAVEIVLPFREGFVSGDKIFTYHFIRSVRDGTPGCLRVMGYAVMRQGKIALVNLLRIPEDLSQTQVEAECKTTSDHPAGR